MLLMAGLYERVFKFPVGKEFAAASFILFTATLLLSILAMLNFAMYSRRTHNTADDPIEWGSRFFAFALFAFALGVLAFVVFVFINH